MPIWNRSATGQKVEAGTVVGKAGEATGENGVQVHFEIRKSTDSLDPQQWLSRR
jgi:septal ring factor EnvC (AmiA/AmiB activator)